MKTKIRKPHYGFDAPGIMLGMLALAALLLVVSMAGLVWADAWLRPLALGVGVVALVPLMLGAMMLAYGLLGKKRMRDHIIGRIDWRGDEKVLDVGAGLGLLTIGAAKKLGRRGRATAIDIWRTEDLSGGGLDQLAWNFAIEGVEDRVAVLTEDARYLSAGDGTVDVVLSLFCVHNINDEGGREKALLEMVRVLKPGGRVIVGEWMPIDRYVAVFRRAGLEVLSYQTGFGIALGPMWIVDARKPAAAQLSAAA